MPNPKPNESKSDYVARFMSSSEAQSDFPDEKQRLAVAYSMYGEKKNASPFGSKEHPWPKSFRTNFIEPGLVFYQDLGPCEVCGDKKTCGEGKCKTEGEMVLVGQQALAKMAQSFVGKPVINLQHEDVEPQTIAEGDADGIVTRVWLDSETGWWNAEFLVWDPATQSNCENTKFSTSCAYNPGETDFNGGEYHNIPYASEILDGEYSHLAIVSNPRYEKARIFVNSKNFVRVKPKGGLEMNWKTWFKGERKNASPINPDDMVKVNGKDVPMKDLWNALPPEEEKPKLNDDSMVSDGKREMTMGKLKENYLNKLADLEKKNEADAKCESCGQAKPKKENAATVPGAAGAEAGHAEHREGAAKKNEQEPIDGEKLPDMRDPKQNNEDNPSDAQAQAKKLSKENSESNPNEVEAQAKKLANEKDEEEKKNAADAEAKAAEEKKNADDAEAKDAEDKKAEELKNAKIAAGKRSFKDLRNARDEGAGLDNVRIMPVSIDDRLKRGQQKYGQR